MILCFQNREVAFVVDEEEGGADVVIAVVEESTEKWHFPEALWLKHL